MARGGKRDSSPVRFVESETPSMRKGRELRDVVLHTIPDDPPSIVLLVPALINNTRRS